jgi:hypothetical protein
MHVRTGWVLTECSYYAQLCIMCCEIGCTQALKPVILSLNLHSPTLQNSEGQWCSTWTFVLYQTVRIMEELQRTTVSLPDVRGGTC